MPTYLEIVIFIHGVSNDLRGKPHRPTYEIMHRGVAERNAAWPTRFLDVEWGWNHDRGAARSHQLLTDAQRMLGARATPALRDARDFTLNPARAVTNGLRDLAFYGFGDMFYYVSESGKSAIRDTVASQIVDFIDGEIGDDPEPYVSLTLLGHSAGSVIAFDFLFSLFYRGEGHVFVQPSGAETPKSDEGMRRLRRAAHASRLRLRRLVTFGSPITMVACRSDAVLGLLARGRELDPADYGLASQWDTGEPVGGVRWINIWDRDDPIAWPIEPLMGDHRGEPAAEDLYVDVSDSVIKAHEAYWASKKVHEIVARRW